MLSPEKAMMQGSGFTCSHKKGNIKIDNIFAIE